MDGDVVEHGVLAVENDQPHAVTLDAPSRRFERSDREFCVRHAVGEERQVAPVALVDLDIECRFSSALLGRDDTPLGEGQWIVVQRQVAQRQTVRVVDQDAAAVGVGDRVGEHQTRALPIDDHVFGA